MKIKRSELKELAKKYIGNDTIDAQNQLMIKIATARAARLSYMTFDGEIDYDKDIKLHDTLLESKHFSPFEHCCKCMYDEEYESFIKGKIEICEDQSIEIGSGIEGWCNNVKGFIPYRYMLENE